MGAKRKLFHGTMNASKSAQILMQAFNFERQGKSFIIFQPARNYRDKGMVTSRALPKGRPAFVIKEEWDGLMFDIVENARPEFLFIDELQFFTPKQVEELTKISIELGIPIFSYGLLISYTGEMFKSSKKAIECGFSLQELKMQCDFCHEKSTHHLLYINGKAVTDGDPIYVGDTEFKSSCYACYLKETQK